MTAIGLPMLRTEAQPQNNVSAMLEYFNRKRDESIVKTARAEFVVQRTDALAWVDH